MNVGNFLFRHDLSEHRQRLANRSRVLDEREQIAQRRERSAGEYLAMSRAELRSKYLFGPEKTRDLRVLGAACVLCGGLMGAVFGAFSNTLGGTLAGIAVGSLFGHVVHVAHRWIERERGLTKSLDALRADREHAGQELAQLRAERATLSRELAELEGPQLLSIETPRHGAIGQVEQALIIGGVRVRSRA